MSDKILFVDDESNILDTLSVMLRKRYDITTALGPDLGLQSLQSSGPFAVVVSDLKMPQMDGFAFLSKVRAASPESICIILTGFADLDAAIKAVDDGHVFQFLTKPCPVNVLSQVLDAGIKQHNLVMTEKELLNGTLHGTIRVLTEALSLANPEAYGRGQRVRTLILRISQMMGRNISWEFDLATMLSHIGCMSLPNNILEEIAAGEEPSQESLRLYNTHPAIGARLIEQIPRLDQVAAIVAEQHKDFHPGQSEGARFLKIAVDHDFLTSSGYSPYEAYGKMLTRKGSYDPEILDVLEKSIAKGGEYNNKFVLLNELTTNMILEEDIVTREGLLLMSKEAELDESVIRRLCKAKSTLKIVEPISVRFLDDKN